MKLKVNDFIEVIGCSANDSKVKNILDKLKLQTPVLDKNRDEFRYLLKDIGVELVFVDESVIKNDEFADIGDGELIFETMFIDKFKAVELPFGIDVNDDYKAVVAKIGRIEDDTVVLFNRKRWFKNRNNVEFLISFEFDDTYKNIERMILSYSHGQIIRQKS